MDAEDHATPPTMPLWVKVFVVIGLVTLLAAALALLLGGDHGPARHLGG